MKDKLSKFYLMLPINYVLKNVETILLYSNAVDKSTETILNELMLIYTMYDQAIRLFGKYSEPVFVINNRSDEQLEKTPHNTFPNGAQPPNSCRASMAVT